MPTLLRLQQVLAQLRPACLSTAQREAQIHENGQNDGIDVETPPIDNYRVPSPLKMSPPATTAKAASKPKILPMPVPRNVPQVKTLGASYADAFGFLNRAEVVMKGIESASSEEKFQLEKDAAKLVRLAWGITGAVAAEKEILALKNYSISLKLPA